MQYAADSPWGSRLHTSCDKMIWNDTEKFPADLRLSVLKPFQHIMAACTSVGVSIS